MSYVSMDNGCGQTVAMLNLPCHGRVASRGVAKSEIGHGLRMPSSNYALNSWTIRTIQIESESKRDWSNQIHASM